jgi:hypothetical protein
MQDASSVVNMSPWVGVIGAIVGWTGFIIVVSMLKDFLSRGFSWALGEFLLNTSSPETTEKLVRWFGNKDEILKCLEEIKDKTNNI